MARESQLHHVTDLPDQDAVEVLVKKLHELVMERQLSGLTEIRDLSKDDETCLLIELKRGADAQPVLDEIAGNLPPE